MVGQIIFLGNLDPLGKGFLKLIENAGLSRNGLINFNSLLENNYLLHACFYWPVVIEAYYGRAMFLAVIML